MMSDTQGRPLSSLAMFNALVMTVREFKFRRVICLTISQVVVPESALLMNNDSTTVFVEVDQREVFVFTEGWAGQGGLPVGMSGRGLVLMSGGIDSPVAAYRMMRRGLRCSFR